MLISFQIATATALAIATATATATASIIMRIINQLNYRRTPLQPKPNLQVLLWFNWFIILIMIGGVVVVVVVDVVVVAVVAVTVETPKISSILFSASNFCFLRDSNSASIDLICSSVSFLAPLAALIASSVSCVLFVSSCCSFSNVFCWSWSLVKFAWISFSVSLTSCFSVSIAEKL